MINVTLNLTWCVRCELNSQRVGKKSKTCFTVLQIYRNTLGWGGVCTVVTHNVLTILFTATAVDGGWLKILHVVTSNVAK